MPPTITARHMEANMQHSTSNLISVCNEIFNPEICHQLAYKHQFIQRASSRLQGHEFIKAMILPNQGLLEDSLNGLCLRIREFNPEVDISAAALAQRINKKAAVKLMQACFQKILQVARNKLTKQYTSLEGALIHFKNVYIEDSTVFELNQKLQKFFQGTKRGGKKGGSSCKSQVKIDLIHNFTTGLIEDAEIFEGKCPDQALAGRILKIIQSGDLMIRDLGYFKIENLRLIAAVGAFYLTRLPPHVKIYLNEKDEKPINLAIYLNKHYKRCAIINLTVWIGDDRLPVRLIAYRNPPEVIKERRRKAYKKAKEMKRNLSQAKLALLDFSLFVTNIPEELLSKEVIGTVYRLRWEIELIFKNWKSLLKIDILKGICLERVHCLLWSRLCMVVLVALLTARFMNLAKKLFQVELSSVKLINYLLRNGNLCEAIKTQNFENLEKKLVQDMLRRISKDKRMRTTMRERSVNLETYYEWGLCA